MLTTDDTNNNYLRRTEDLERIAVLEVRVNDHEEDIHQLIKHQQELSESLSCIVDTLKQVRTALITAILVFVASQVGVVEAAKALIKLL